MSATIGPAWPGRRIAALMLRLARATEPVASRPRATWEQPARLRLRKLPGGWAWDYAGHDWSVLPGRTADEIVVIHYGLAWAVAC
jgi:hypothetical protein